MARLLHTRCVRGGREEAPTERYAIGTDSEVGTARDTQTGLMWQRASYEPLPYIYRRFEQPPPPTANGLCSALELGVYDDWRFPTPGELQTIVDETRGDSVHAGTNPAIDLAVFPDTTSHHYWTATGEEGPLSWLQWVVHFASGLTAFLDAEETGRWHARTRCVG